MPHGDGIGPMGFGPMTGRTAGHCAGFPTPGFMNPIPGRECRGRGRGFGGRGRGRGHGWRHQYWATGLPGWMRAGRLSAWGAPPGHAYAPPYAPPFYGPQTTPEQELQALKGQAEYFEDALERIRKRIEELEAAQSEKQE